MKKILSTFGFILLPIWLPFLVGMCSSQPAHAQAIAPGQQGYWIFTGSANGGTPAFPLLPGNGNTTVPVYAFANNPNTGVFLVNVGTLGMTVNGTTVLTLNSAGNANFTGGLSLGGSGTITGDGNSVFTLPPHTTLSTGVVDNNDPNQNVYYGVINPNIYFNNPSKGSVYIGLFAGDGRNPSTFPSSDSYEVNLGAYSTCAQAAETGSGGRGVCVGAFSKATGNRTVCIGANTVCGTNGVAIGRAANANFVGVISTAGTVAIGFNAAATLDHATAIGVAANANNNFSTALGQGATTTADHQVMLGTSSETVVAPGPTTLNGNTTLAAYLYALNGNVQYPAYAFASDHNSGMYYTTATGGSVNLAAGGVVYLTVNTNGVNMPAGFNAAANNSVNTVSANISGSPTNPTFSLDTSAKQGLYKPGTNQFGITVNGAGAMIFDATQNAMFAGTGGFAGTNTGASSNIKSVSANTTLSGGTTTIVQIPAGSFVMGVTCRVTTTITGATSWSLGDGTTATRWASTKALASGTTSTQADYGATGLPAFFQAATNVVATANGSNFTGGVLRCVVFYHDVSAPTG